MPFESSLYDWINTFIIFILSDKVSHFGGLSKKKKEPARTVGMQKSIKNMCEFS